MARQPGHLGGGGPALLLGSCEGRAEGLGDTVVFDLESGGNDVWFGSDERTRRPVLELTAREASFGHGVSVIHRAPA